MFDETAFIRNKGKKTKCPFKSPGGRVFIVRQLPKGSEADDLREVAVEFGATVKLPETVTGRLSAKPQTNFIGEDAGEYLDALLDEQNEM